MKTLNRRTLVKSLAAGSVAGLSPRVKAGSRPFPEEMEADVCVLGAGASGMFAAMSLRERGYKVIVLDKENRVGGHALTYQDRDSHSHTDLGVRFYPDIPIVRETFQKYGIALRAAPQHDVPKYFIDVISGQESSYRVPNPAEVGTSLTKFDLLRDEKYAYLNGPGFELPQEMPDELLGPLKDFLQTHEIRASFPALSIHLLGKGKADDVPLLYALKALRKDIIRNTAQDSFLTAEAGADAIYQVMASELGEDLILSAKVTRVVREDGNPVRLSLLRDDAEETIITAGKIIVAYPPSLPGLATFDLNVQEQNLLAQFSGKYYWTALVRSEGLLPNAIILNNQVLPGMYIAIPSGIPGLTNVLYGSETPMTEDEVKLNIVTDLERLQGRFTLAPVCVYGFEAFASHTPFSPQVSLAELKTGFYAKMKDLQGQRSTYYTGAAFDTNDTSSVWLHAKALVEQNFPIRDPR